MTRKFLLSGFGVCLLAFGGIAQADPINLFGYSLNIDGTVSDVIDSNVALDPLPAGVDDSGFDNATGLGSIAVTITGAGSHDISAFFDHDIETSTNSFFNESGSASGTLAAGQSWEIDEPGYIDGDIYENFQLGSSALDNLIGSSVYGPTTFPDDVSLAMGWAFTLAAGETATINFLLAENAPLGGFTLQHLDSISNETFYFSSTLGITTGGPIGVPEPGTLWLLGAGLLGLGLMRHRNLTDS